MKNVCAVILAAGEARRLKSSKPKHFCEVLFKPMLSWVADALAGAGIGSVCAVLREGDALTPSILPSHYATAVQPADKGKGYGTGYAVMMAADYIKNGGFTDVVVLFGDSPFTTEQDLRSSYALHKSENNAVTLMTAEVADPTGYGRILREAGKLAAIVEQRDADAFALRIKEINSGGCWFDAAFLLGALTHLSCQNSQGEYYLTDTVSYAVNSGRAAGACLVHPDAALGANDRKGLAALNQIARAKILDRHMAGGVDIPFSDGVIIGPDVEISPDARILPGTILRGKTKIGAGCEIGPGSYLDNAVVGEGCRVISTYIDGSVLEDNVKIGPMSNIRPGCTIKAGAKIGDFVEVKSSVIGEKTALAHLTYIGDSDVGAGCNFGCGVVTTNYDGTAKHRTTVGDNAFIGCNVNLIPPVTVGGGAYIAAATTVTGDVPPDALAIGRPRQEIHADWAKRKGLYKGK